jgi:hypothetical protein
MNVSKPWTPSSIVLIVAGIALIGVGLYFILLRPALLPEDVRYLALPAAQLDILRPRLELWLTQVFRVMGGYVFGDGRAGGNSSGNGIPNSSKGPGNRRPDRRSRFHRLDGSCQFLDRLGFQMGSARDGAHLGLQPCPLLV